MKSILRFLLFVAILALAVSALYFWRAFSLASAQRAQMAQMSPTAPGTAPIPNPAASPSPTPQNPDSASSPTQTAPAASPTPAASSSAPAATAAPATPPAPAPAVTGTLSTLAALDRDFQELVSRVRPAVVSITAENQRRVINSMQPGMFGIIRLPPNLGSGVIVSTDGHIVTNLHVIRDANAIEIQLYDGRSFPAEVIGADPLTDIALLKIEADGLHALPFGNSDLVRPGQIVFAVGNPYGLQETVTQGIISGIGRRSTSETVNEFFQTDTAINPGNSGGPLLNLQGEIIGINNAIHTQTGGWQGISFSIPSNTAKRVFEDLRTYGRVIRSWFGVVWGRVIDPRLSAQLGLPDTQGVLIQQVVPNSPADAAGVRPGDVIVSFNGRKIIDGIDLRNRVAETEVGEEVRVGIIRRGRPLELTARLEEYPGN